MGCSVYVYAIYGVKTKLSDLVENVVVETEADCHPDKISDDDKYCPECGNETVQKTEQKQVKKSYQELLPEYEYLDMGLEEWFDMGTFPQRSLDVVSLYGYKQESCFIGKKLREVGDIMYGSTDSHVITLDDGDYVDPEIKDFLLKLGYEEDEIGLHIVPQILV